MLQLNCLDYFSCFNYDEIPVSAGATNEFQGNTYQIIRYRMQLLRSYIKPLEGVDLPPGAA